MSPSTHVRTGELALVGVVLIWGCNFAVMKTAVDRVDPLTFNAARFTLSVLFVGALHAVEVRRRGGPTWPPRELWRPVVALGVAGHAAYLAGLMLGLERTSSGSASLVLASAPIWTALTARLAGIESLTGRAWSGLLLAVAGTAAVTGGAGLELGASALEGNLLVLAAAMAWGVYTAASRRYLGGASPTSLAFWTMAGALPVVVALGVPGLRELDPAEIDAGLVGATLYSGLLGTGLAYVLWNLSIRGLGPARTSVATCLVPVVALLLGWAWLDEPLGAIQLGGGALVLLGLVVLGRR